MKQSLLFGLIVTIPLVWANNAEITTFLKGLKIIAESAPANAVNFLNVTYENGVAVNMGKELTPTQTKDAPMVDWDSKEDHFYTLTMVKSDTPPFNANSKRQVRHWMVVNIPGKDIQSGDVVNEYLSPGPPKGVGMYLYVFQVYEQPSKLEFGEQFIDKSTIEGRPDFCSFRFAAKHGLGLPIAANYFMAQYDDYVPVVHAQLGM